MTNLIVWAHMHSECEHKKSIKSIKLLNYILFDNLEPASLASYPGSGYKAMLANSQNSCTISFVVSVQRLQYVCTRLPFKGNKILSAIIHLQYSVHKMESGGWSRTAIITLISPGVCKSTAANTHCDMSTICAK